MNESRPGPIVGVCTVWVAFTAYAFYRFMNADLSALPDWFSGYYMAVTAVGFIGISGIWLMRKWGLAVFTLGVIIDQFMLVSHQHWNVMSLLLPMMVIMVAISQLQEMK